jgi:hypothetical protein
MTRPAERYGDPKLLADLFSFDKLQEGFSPYWKTVKPKNFPTSKHLCMQSQFFVKLPLRFRLISTKNRILKDPQAFILWSEDKFG